jgi:large subunit ribosomal protein L6
VNQNQVIVTGPDKQAVGEFAARIRSQRTPEPYNGKGVKYFDEVIIRKQGKAFGS